MKKNDCSPVGDTASWKKELQRNDILFPIMQSREGRNPQHFSYSGNILRTVGIVRDTCLYVI